MNMDRKIIIGIVVAAVLVVVLIIAIAVPLSTGGDDENDRVDTSGLPPLKRAKIILGRVPLVDGYAQSLHFFRSQLTWKFTFTDTKVTKIGKSFQCDCH